MMNNVIRLLMKLLIIIIWYYWTLVLILTFWFSTKFSLNTNTSIDASLEIVRRHDFASKKGCHYEIWLIRLEQLTCSKMKLWSRRFRTKGTTWHNRSRLTRNARPIRTRI